MSYGDGHAFTDLQPLDDVPVVFGRREAGVSSGRVLGRKPPAEDALLHHVVGLDKQVVHLTVQVYWDGNGSALSWVNTAERPLLVCGSYGNGTADSANVATSASHLRPTAL